MNIAIISSNSGYQQLADLLSKKNSVDKVFHYGASSDLVSTNKYSPNYFKLPQTGIDTAEITSVLDNILKNKIDYVLASGLAVPSHDVVHQVLNENNIPYFFVKKELTALEKVKSLSKTLLNFLKIPTGEGITVTGEYLFENFKSIPRPFVVKLNHVFQYGRQTTIVDNNNFEESYLDFFSFILTGEKRVTNINLNNSLIIENYISIKKEYSYHCLMNNNNWQYFGSARDYKKSLDGDQGFNTVGMGSYNINDVDPKVHEYADKIFQYLKSKNYQYKGFMYLGIAVDENDTPIVLEINTRSGDPELNCIIDTIDNDLAEVFYLASSDKQIPKIIHNDKKSLTVRIINAKDWLSIPADLPMIDQVPDGIFYGIESEDDFRVKHSHVTATSDTLDESRKRIYEFLDSQKMGQFYYRRDIGIFK